MSRRAPLGATSEETDSVRWMIGTAAFMLAMLVVLGIFTVLEWRCVQTGDVWGAITYGGLAFLTVVATLRALW